MGDKIKRYPSIRAFQKNEATLFIGRETETRLLFNKVIAEKIVLLFARSGIGKSSLINAGLVPMLEGRGLLTIDVRLSITNDPTDTPIQVFQKLLAHYLDKRKYELLVAQLRSSNAEHSPGLWEYFKCCTFPLASTPVLIFDQFEQFFSFPISNQDEFLEQFKDLLADDIPLGFWEWYTDITDVAIKDQYREWLEQPQIKVLFAIRSDKIFEMNKLTHFIPNILRNRFELEPLKDKEAAKAIVVPAGIKNPSLYISPSFKYQDTLLTNIITRLKGGNNIIETTQLQIICSEIESRIILSPFTSIPNKPEDYEVTTDDLINIGGIENIISNFYQNQIKSAGDEKLQEVAKTLIENNLYDKDSKSRKLAFKEAVITILETEKKRLGIVDLDPNLFINKLLDLRLIREDYRENKKFYEISHDYLLNAIGESFEIREAKRLAKEYADLQLRNNELRELKERAEKSEAKAREKQTEAENATIVANSALVTAKKLRRRSEVMGGALVVMAMISVGYFGIQNDRLSRNKKKITKTLASNCAYEAVQRYNIGDKILAHALWDTAKFFNPQDENLQKEPGTRTFPPFTGSTITDLMMSDNLDYVGNRLSNSQFITWRIDHKTNEIKHVLTVNDIKKFYFLPDSRVLVIDTSNTSYYYDLGKNKGPFKLFEDKSAKAMTAEIFEESNLLILTKGNIRYFLTLDDLQPIQKLNSLFASQTAPGKITRKGDSEDFFNSPDKLFFRYEFVGVDKETLVIIVNNSKYYSYGFYDGMISRGITVPTENQKLIGKSIKKVAFNGGRSLKLLDLNSGKIQDTKITLGGFDRPMEFFNNDKTILLEHASEEDGEPLSYSLYRIPEEKRVFQIDAMEYSKEKNIAGFLDTSDVFHLFDVIAEKTVYRQRGVISFSFYKGSNKIYLALSDGKSKILFPKEGGSITEVAGNGSFPVEVYGDKFYKVRDSDPRFRKYNLEFQDTLKNNIRYLKSAFKEYIDKEIRNIIGYED